MKQIFYLTGLSFSGLFAVLVLNSGCQSSSSSTETSDSVVTTSSDTVVAIPTDTLCFQQILGRDTTMLHLVLTGRQASGEIDINPYEKDRARGSFVGSRNGCTIDANWKRSGEGTTEPYALTLRLSADSVSWLEGERVRQHGQWVLKQSDNNYRYVLTKAPCR